MSESAPFGNLDLRKSFSKTPEFTGFEGFSGITGLKTNFGWDDNFLFSKRSTFVGKL